MNDLINKLDSSAIVAIVMSFVTMCTTLLTLIINNCITIHTENRKKKNQEIGSYLAAVGRDLTDSRDSSKSDYGKALGPVLAYADENLKEKILKLDEYIVSKNTHAAEAKALFVEISRELLKK